MRYEQKLDRIFGKTRQRKCADGIQKLHPWNMTSTILSSIAYVVNIAKKNATSFAPDIVPTDDACPFYLITAPPCRYARFASLAS